MNTLIFYCRCFFDAVKGEVAYVAMSTIPSILILVMNTILYLLTWYKLRMDAKRLEASLGKSATALQTSNIAARNMSLFVVAFFVQWWSVVLWGIWDLATTEEVPVSITILVVTFANTGGVLNGIVFIIIRRRKLKERYSTSSRKGTTASKKSERRQQSNVSQEGQGEDKDISDPVTVDTHM